MKDTISVPTHALVKVSAATGATGGSITISPTTAANSVSVTYTNGDLDETTNVKDATTTLKIKIPK